jgi:peptidoglycan hydrolase-like protein with peptidoglycan-binding domain
VAHASTAPKTASATKAVVSAKAGSKKPGSKKPGSKKTVAQSRRSIQQQPTTDRYREIQQALADKGYFAGQPDGNWGPDSVDALKRFQRDQSLTEDGKIGSLSLIALGLGPRRAAPAEAADEAPAADKSPLQQVQH